MLLLFPTSATGCIFPFQGLVKFLPFACQELIVPLHFSTRFYPFLEAYFLFLATIFHKKTCIKLKLYFM